MLTLHLILKCVPLAQSVGSLQRNVQAVNLKLKHDLQNLFLFYTDFSHTNAVYLGKVIVESNKKYNLSRGVAREKLLR
jgi:hypothetical protein